MPNLSVVIITRNEEKNIGRCIDSVATVADEVIVLDSFSDDSTITIASSKGAIIKQSPFYGYKEQKNLALKFASNDYVLSLDADEGLSEELASSILQAKKEFLFSAYSMNRSNFYCGRFIRHGLWYPDRKIRLFDKKKANWGGLNPHDRIEMTETSAIKHLKGDILHYAYLSNEELKNRNEELSSIAAESLFLAGQKNKWTRCITSPCWSFINGYIFRLGFLDGYRGFVIAVSTAQQTFLKYTKLFRLFRQDLQKNYS